MDLTYQFMLPLLETFYKLTGSYGWSLVLLTLSVRAILWPLVAKQTESMQRMSMLSPTLKKMQERYKDNPELMQKKLMEFYAKNRVNPMGGCLPMLLQLPIFFALFATCSGPPFGDKPVNVPIKVIEKQVKEVKKEISNDAVPYVSTLDPGSFSAFLQKPSFPELSKVTAFPGETLIPPGEAIDFGVRAVDGKLPDDFKAAWQIIKDNKPVVPEDASIDENGHAVFTKTGDYQVQAIIPGVAKNVSFGPVSGLGKVAQGMDLLKPENFDALALILLFGFTMWLSQKYTMATSKPKDEPVDEQTRVQQDTMKILPLVTTGTFFFIPLPVGVLIYIVLSNVVQSLQTWILMKKPVPPLVGVDDLDIELAIEGNGSSGNKKKAIGEDKPAANKIKLEGSGQPVSTSRDNKAKKKKKK